MCAAPFDRILLSTEQGVHEKRIMLHFNNAPIHNTEGVQESIINFESRRMEYPPYSPDLAPCNFFLFSAMKQAFAGQYYDIVGGPCMEVEAFLGGISADFLYTVFQEWVRRLQRYCEGGGACVALTLQKWIFMFVIAQIGDGSPSYYLTACNDAGYNVPDLYLSI
jgi:hypothetical protein